jgi:4-hydroxy-3-polyprenylbenzoate decarboxylase
VKLIIGISGASGVTLTLKFIDFLPKNIEKYVIISENAKVVFDKENNINILDNKNIAAITASGSFKSDAMIILPCSINTMSKISVGIADNLITRTALVMLKEKRKLILAPREMPYSTIALENMTKLSLNGVIIAPPVMGYYSNQQTLEDMEKFIIGKWFDLLDIEHSLFKRWEG